MYSNFNEALAMRDVELMSSPYDDYEGEYDGVCNKCRRNDTYYIYKDTEYCEECLKDVLWNEHIDEIDVIEYGKCECGDRTEYLFRGKPMCETCIIETLIDEHYEDLEYLK